MSVLSALPALGASESPALNQGLRCPCHWSPLSCHKRETWSACSQAGNPRRSFGSLLFLPTHVSQSGVSLDSRNSFGFGASVFPARNDVMASVLFLRSRRLPIAHDEIVVSPPKHDLWCFSFPPSFFQDGLKAVENLKPSIETLSTDLHTVSSSPATSVWKQLCRHHYSRIHCHLRPLCETVFMPHTLSHDCCCFCIIWCLLPGGP